VALGEIEYMVAVTFSKASLALSDLQLTEEHLSSALSSDPGVSIGPPLPLAGHLLL